MSHPSLMTPPSREAASVPEGHRWRMFPIPMLVLGVLLLAGSYFIGGGEGEHGHAQWYFSWLVALMFWASVGLGALFFVLTQYATRAGWSVVVRRVAENIMAPLPMFILLFIPVVMGMHDLYHWAHHDAVAHDEILQAKEGFLNSGFFIGRGFFYVLSWAFLAWWFRKKSVAQDDSGAVADTALLQARSYPAIVLLGLTVSFAGVDWAMSLDPHWYSTMWGVWYFSGAMMAGFSMLALLVVAGQKCGAIGDWITKEHHHDLGKLVFAFTIFWTYIAFSQYFIIWNGNIPEETTFYAHRMGNSWESVGMLLMVGHFGVPFLLLMPRTVKRISITLGIGAAYMLVMHYFDILYCVMPVQQQHGMSLGAVDVLTMLGMGALFMGLVFRAMGSASTLPIGDPRLRESMAHQNF